MRIKLKQLLDSVVVEFEKAEKRKNNAIGSALEIAKSAALSPSQAGDRFHSQGAADLAKEMYETVENLRNEIEIGVNQEIPEFTSVPSYIKLEGLEVYLVNNPILLKGFNLISKESPLGSGLESKKVGDIVNEKKILEIG